MRLIYSSERADSNNDDVIYLFLDFDWSLSNDFIVSASLDGTARVWNTSSGQNVRVLPDTYGSPVLSCHFMPLNNNMIVVSFSFR